MSKENKEKMVKVGYGGKMYNCYIDGDTHRYVSRKKDNNITLSKEEITSKYIKVFREQPVFINEYAKRYRLKHDIYNRLVNEGRVTEYKLLAMYFMLKQVENDLKVTTEVLNLATLIVENNLDLEFKTRYKEIHRRRLRNGEYKKLSKSVAIQLNYTNVEIAKEINKKMRYSQIKPVEIVERYLEETKKEVE